MADFSVGGHDIQLDKHMSNGLRDQKLVNSKKKSVDFIALKMHKGLEKFKYLSSDVTFWHDIFLFAYGCFLNLELFTIVGKIEVDKLVDEKFLKLR